MILKRLQQYFVRSILIAFYICSHDFLTVFLFTSFFVVFTIVVPLVLLLLYSMYCFLQFWCISLSDTFV